jgi:CHAT domain-containing protein
VLDDTCRWLWDAIAARLDTAGVLSPEVVLIPAGALASLPIHAAYTPTNEGRRWLLEECAVSYAPSAWFLREVGTEHVQNDRRCAATVDGVRRGLTVVVSNPEPTSLPILSYADMELDAVSAGPGGVMVLSGPRANRREVATALASAPAVHLAGDEPLSVDDLLVTPLTTVKLAVLSACESGIIGEAVPDEMIGLPVALLQAGARTVVATQWAVQDLATSLVVGEFYSRWRSGATPAAALQAAQMWLASATFGDLSKRFPAMFEERAPVGGVARRIWERARPYAHPTAWAAFTVVGDGYW